MILEKVSPLLWEFERENGILKTVLGLIGEIFECNYVPNFVLLLCPTSRVKCCSGWEYAFSVFFLIVRLGNLFIKIIT
jgi:hypothetical protein